MEDLPPDVARRILKAREEREGEQRPKTEEALEARDWNDVELVHSYLLKDTTVAGEEKFYIQTSSGKVKEITLQSGGKELNIQNTDIKPWLDYKDPVAEYLNTPDIVIQGDQDKIAIERLSDEPIKIRGKKIGEISIGSITVGGAKRETDHGLITASEVDIQGPGERINVKATPQGLKFTPKI